MERVLVMMEVSQKQAYIFNSNLLQDNVNHSAAISWVTSPEYLEDICKEGFNREENLVYAGGGHTVLEFLGNEEAKVQIGKVTKRIKEDFPDIDLFVKKEKYDPRRSAGENLEELSKKLESKKSRKFSAFHQGSFGIEKLDSTTRRPVRVQKEKKVPRDMMEKERQLWPRNYRWAYRFEDLGTSQGQSSFIAVIHIDGNGMGKRVKEFRKKYGKLSWEDYKKKLRMFSEEVDRNFKDALCAMEAVVAKNLEEGRLKELSLKSNFFPLRGIIAAGDDICFVSEGRIGLECAAIFLKKLAQQVNQVDGKGYEACAGVAIVHQKYPFYRAYDLAEQLCANAKKYAATLGGASVLDWHMEYGESKDELGEIRREYIAQDGSVMVLRPYVVCAGKAATEKAGYRKYENFRNLMRVLRDGDGSYASGKLKKLRSVLRDGEEAVQYYVRKNLMEELGVSGFQRIYEEEKLERIGTGRGQEKAFYGEIDGKRYSLQYDAVEAMDLYLELVEEGEGIE